MSNVSAFATLIASKRITPPLSIGLFGDWGPERASSWPRCERRSQNARDARRGGRTASSTSASCRSTSTPGTTSRPTSGRASSNTCFRNLKLTSEEPEAEVIERRREELLKKLDKLMAERAAAEQKVEKAELERDHAAQDLEAKKKAADASVALVQGMRAKDVWELVTISPGDRSELQKYLDQLGAGQILQSTEDVRNTVEELRTVATRMKLLSGWLCANRALWWCCSS